MDDKIYWIITRSDAGNLTIAEAVVIKDIENAYVVEAIVGKDYYVGNVSKDGLYFTEQDAEKDLMLMKLSNTTTRRTGKDK